MAEHIKINDITPRIEYEGDGVTVGFPYPFPIFADDNMTVYLDEAAQTSGFTVTGAGVSEGGTVTFDAAPADGVMVTLARDVPIKRTTDFQTAGAFRADTINDELDTITAILQELLLKHGLTVRVSVTDGVGLELPGVATRANKHLAFDGVGAVSLTSEAPVSDLKRTDPPITLIDGTAAYALPAEIQSGLDEGNYQAWLVGGGLLVPGDEFTVAADTLTLTTTPTSGNGLAGQELMVELVRPAINATAVQPGTISTQALVDGAVTSAKLSFPGQAYGDLLSRDSTPAWVPLPAPTSDGKYILGVDVSGGGSVKTFNYKNKALVNDWSWPAFNSTPKTIVGTILDNDTKMTITEGDEIFTRSITIDSDTAGIVIWVNVYVSCASRQTIRVGLFRDGATDALLEGRYRGHDEANPAARTVPLMYQASALTPGAVTYSVRVGCTNTTGRVNEEYYSINGGPGRKAGGNVGSSMLIMELGSKT